METYGLALQNTFLFLKYLLTQNVSQHLQGSWVWRKDHTNIRLVLPMCLDVYKKYKVEPISTLNPARYKIRNHPTYMFILSNSENKLIQNSEALT